MNTIDESKLIGVGDANLNHNRDEEYQTIEFKSRLENPIPVGDFVRVIHSDWFDAVVKVHYCCKMKTEFYKIKGIIVRYGTKKNK